MTRQTFPRGLIHATAVVSLLLAVYTMVGFFLVPRVLERKLPEYAQRSGIDFSIGALAFNPFSLTLEGRDLRAGFGEDAATFDIQRFTLDLKAGSLLRRTWVVSEANASGVQARLRLGGMPTRSHAKANAVPAFAHLPPVILERMHVADAHVELLGGADGMGLGPIHMQAENLSTLPSQYGHFLLTATLPQRGALQVAGEIALAPLAVRGSMELQGLRVENVAALALQGPRTVLPPTGQLDAEFGFHIARGDGTAALALQRISAVLADFAIPRAGDEPPMIAFASMVLAGGEIDFATRSASLESLDVEEARWALERTADGRFDIERFWQAFASLDGSPKTEAPLWRARIDSVALRATATRYIDRAANRPPTLPERLDTGAIDVRLAASATIGPDVAHVAISGLELSVRDLAARAADSQAPLASAQSLALTQGALDTRVRSIDVKEVRVRKLSGSVTRDRAGILRLTGPIAGQATKHAQPTTASPSGEHAAGDFGSWSVRLGRLQADTGKLRFLDESFAAPLEVIAAEARFAFGLALAPTTESQLVLSDVEAEVSGLRARNAGARSEVEVAHVALNGARLDTASKRFSAQSLAASDGRLALARNPDGSMRIGGLALQSLSAKTAPSSGGSAPWHHELDAVRIAGLEVSFADRSFTPALTYRVGVDGTLRDVNDTSTAPMRVDATIVAARGGTMRLQGTLAQDLGHANGRIRARNLSLAPLDPLLARFAHLRFASGSASADVRADYRAGRTPLFVMEGDVGLAGVQLNDTGRDAQFAAWQSLAAERVRLTLSPDQLDIADVRVTAPQATVIVGKDRSFNLSRVLKTEGRTDVGQSDLMQERNAAPLVRIGRITFAHGRMQFADLSLVLPFSTEVHALDGVLVGLTTAPDGRAELQLDGRIEDYGSARARGSLSAADPTNFMNISVAFNNVRIPPLSPYTATFAGRMIESGRLWLDLDYHISAGRLSGENSIVLKDVELGERVKSRTAADLPLELALALLEDSEGRVRLDIPISGNVGDPEFDYGKVIRAAIGRTFQRIVTAPFRALAHLFGGQDTELVRRVEFEPGSDELAPAEQEQLALLAKGLMERPSLDLIVLGPYDPALDERAMREEAVRESVAAALGRAPLAGGGDPIAFTDPDTQKVLDAMAAKQLDSEMRTRLRDAGEARDDNYYARLLDALAAQVHLSDSELQMLAANRARAIAQQLTHSGLQPERIVGSQIGAVASAQRGIVVAILDLRAGLR